MQRKTGIRAAAVRIYAVDRDKATDGGWEALRAWVYGSVAQHVDTVAAW